MPWKYYNNTQEWQNRSTAQTELKGSLVPLERELTTSWMFLEEVP